MLFIPKNNDDLYYFFRTINDSREIYYYFPTILLEIFSLFFENSSPREIFSLQNQTLTFLKFQSPASEIKNSLYS
ncbi:hypothetical protein PROVRETT_08150 [Providencia rettgeri DSM 1131]|nr:hypothetical protein PROVRETT_08150 [Providencia rettgeri DSM 1131]